MADTFSWVKPISARTFTEAEEHCNFVYNKFVEKYGTLWHVSTPGNLSEIINITELDFKFSVSNAAISAAELGVVVISDTQMSTHTHTIMAGTRQLCSDYLKAERERLYRYLESNDRFLDLTAFKCDDPVEITDLDCARNEIAYCNRNGYVGSPQYHPFSYQWGAGAYYFNPYAKSQLGIPFNNIPFKTKRYLMRRRVTNMPEGYRYANGMILPNSYARIDIGESLFRDAHHYFNSVVKNVESYSAIAKRYGDKVILPREELYSVVTMMARRDYDIKQPSLLPPSAKCQIAKVMHYDYNATNSQIQSILKLPIEQVREMFPMSK